VLWLLAVSGGNLHPCCGSAGPGAAGPGCGWPLCAAPEAAPEADAAAGAAQVGTVVGGAVWAGEDYLAAKKAAGYEGVTGGGGGGEVRGEARLPLLGAPAAAAPALLLGAWPLGPERPHPTPCPPPAARRRRCRAPRWWT
jgi:hypothetical protein